MNYARLLGFGAPDWTELYDVLREDVLTCALHWHSWQRRQPSGRVLIIPPCDDPGSLGDHAMITVAMRQIRQSGYPVIDLASEQDWPLPAPPDGRFRYDRTVGLRHRLRALRQLRQYDHVFLIGADVVDGAYGDEVLDRIALLGLAAKLGCPVSILGSSFSEAPSPEAIALLRQLPRSARINARDPVSRARMERHLRRPIALTADLAVLLAPDRDHPDLGPTRQWIAAQRALGFGIVGFNINGMEIAGNLAMKRSLSVLAALLGQAGFALVLVPHDSRDAISDVDALRDLEAELSSEQTPVHLVRTRSVAAIKGLLAEVDVLVTGRMHAAILAMGSGTPAIAFPYNGKFEGLYAMLGLADANLLISPSDLLDHTAAVAQRIEAAIAQRQDLRERLQRAWAEISAGAIRNFDDLAPCPAIPASAA